MTTIDAKVKNLMKAADSYAHVYAFVGDDTMPRYRGDLETAIRAAIAQPVPQASALEPTSQPVVGDAETITSHLKWALLALDLVGNKLRATGSSEDDTQMINLTAAKHSIKAALAYVLTPIDAAIAQTVQLDPDAIAAKGAAK